MANLSAETQAIIDRLKAEGDLARNSGTNSIRSVKIQLDKFDKVFDSISNNIAEQTDMLRIQMGLAVEAKEKLKTQEQLQEITPPAAKEKEESDSEQKSKSDEKINKMGDKIASAFTLKNLALMAGGLFVGYNFLKGYINESTDGGFDRMINNIKTTDWKSMSDGIGKMTTSIKEIDWDEVTGTVNRMTTGLSTVNWVNFASAINGASTKLNSFISWLDETGVGDIVTAVAAGGLVTAGARGAAGGLFDSLRKGGGGGKGGLIGRLSRVRFGIAAVVAGLGIAYGDEISAFLQENTGASEEDANSIKDIMIGTTSLALMFGLTSPVGLAVLAVGAAVGLGTLIGGWIEQYKDRKAEEFNRDVDKALRDAEAERNANPGADLSESVDRNLRVQRSEAERNLQLALSPEEHQRARDAIANIDAQLGQQSLGSGFNEVNARAFTQRALSGDQAAIDQIFAYAQQRERDSANNWFRFSSEKDYVRDMILSMGSYSQNEGEFDPDALDAWDDFANRVLEERGYRRGTGGFKNFGSGTAAILHGHEAVVPLNSPEGQILKNLFNGPTPADVASGGGGGLGTTIINAPTIAPSSVNVSNGGSSVNQLSISNGGGGGMGPSMLPYGLTGAFS